MQEKKDVSTWPKSDIGEAWWDPSDDAVGSAEYVSNGMMWSVRILLQLKIENGVITDARCHSEETGSLRDSTTDPDASRAIVDHLKGRKPADVPRFANQTMWCPKMGEEAIYAALHDWATKRIAHLPPPPLPEEPAYPAPLWRRVLRRIPPFGGRGA